MKALRNLKFAFLVASSAVFIVVFLITPATASAPPPPPPIEDVVVPPLQIPVTLDGSIIDDEWSDAVMIDLTFYFNDPDSTTRSGKIYLKHDCTNLWVCVQMEDPNEDLDSWVAFFYDAIPDGYVPGTGDDEKAIVHPSLALDIAIIGGGVGWDNDTDLGGTLDVQGATGWAPNMITYEFVHPLNSGDANGNDVALQPGDSILTAVLVGDPELDNPPDYYYGYPLTNYNFILTSCPVGGEVLSINTLQLLTPYLLIIAIAVAGTAGILIKKRIS